MKQKKGFIKNKSIIRIFLLLTLILPVISMTSVNAAEYEEYTSYFGNGVTGSGSNARIAKATNASKIRDRRWAELTTKVLSAHAGFSESYTNDTNYVNCLDHHTISASTTPEGLEKYVSDRSSSNWQNRRLKAYGIIEIKGGNVTTSGNVGTHINKHVGAAAAYMAHFAALRWNGSVTENYVFNKGWKQLVAATPLVVSPNLARSGNYLDGTTGTLSAVEQATIENVDPTAYMDLTVAGTGVGKGSSATILGTKGTWGKYKTKIGPYVLTGVKLNNAKIKCSVKIKTLDGSEYGGVLTNQDPATKVATAEYYVYSTAGITGEITSMELTQKSTAQSWHAVIIPLDTNYSQTRLINWGEKWTNSYTTNLKTPLAPVTGTEDKDVDTPDEEVVPPMTYEDVPIPHTPQTSPDEPTAPSTITNKYVSKVNGESLAQYATDADVKSMAQNIESKINSLKSAGSGSDSTITSTVTQAINTLTSLNNAANIKVVEIEPGDTVTFDVLVSNVGNGNAASVTVSDILTGINPAAYEISAGGLSAGGASEFTTVNLPAGIMRIFQITVKFKEYTESLITNTATATTVPPGITIPTPDSIALIKMKPYKVSLEKYISAVDGNTIDKEEVEIDREGNPEYRKPLVKHNNVVVAENGSYVTYTIKVTNDSDDTAVRITSITDTLPTGITGYALGGYKGKTTVLLPNTGAVILTNTAKTLLQPGESTTCELTVKVAEVNLSLSVFKNTATITTMVNRHSILVPDKTPLDNTDSDYFELRDIEIKGTVWNDLSFTKVASTYDGTYEKLLEKPIEGIDVYLYRGLVQVAHETTDKNGNYTFNRESLQTLLPDKMTRFIKGPRTLGTNRWTGVYYSYYVVFKYDGITYTTSPNGKSYVPISAITLLPTHKIDSNAAEDNTLGKPGLESRAVFDTRFKVINNKGNALRQDISYTTKNERNYIPQSNHAYNQNSMSMQASTNLITLHKSALLEEQLQYVGCGLRGKDIFDLELNTEVAYTKVTINGQTGTYEYEGSNKVTIRSDDLVTKKEDMANIASEKITNTSKEIDQDMRRTDYDFRVGSLNTTHNTDSVIDYKDPKTYLEINYRITVKNASVTDGYATKVIDYYDDRCSFDKAYLQTKDVAGNRLLETRLAAVDNVEKGDGYKAVLVTLPPNYLKQGQSTTFYVRVHVTNPNSTLTPLVQRLTTQVPIYNMAEIYEYTTKSNVLAGQSVYTKGILDKDSAPGSANEEVVRLTSLVESGTLKDKDAGLLTPSNATTVEYYFKRLKLANYWKAANDLRKLKYEDDTYTAPTIYFTTQEVIRETSGYVFKDKTTVYQTTYIKSGNGLKDAGEIPVVGATVELVEYDKTTVKPENISEKDGVVRYRTTTNAQGYYEFKKFRPGNYVIRLRYGDNKATVLRNVAAGGKNITTSFNGEDYQSTNNTGYLGTTKSTTLTKELRNTTEKYWYMYNATNKVSVGTDNVARREEVARRVTGYTDAEMKVLDNIRKNRWLADSAAKPIGTMVETRLQATQIDKLTPTAGSLIADTHMYATSPNFTIALEKPLREGVLEKTEDATKYNKTYSVPQMNFGLAEVPKTTVSLKKYIKAFTIKDAAGENTLAQYVRKQDTFNYKKRSSLLNTTTATSIKGFKPTDLQANSYTRTRDIDKDKKDKVGDILNMFDASTGYNGYDVSIADDKLQGARLEIAFGIDAETIIERNFDATGWHNVITGLTDFVDNDLTYNPDLSYDGQVNKNNWKVTSYDESQQTNQRSLKNVVKETTDYIGNRLITADKRFGGTLLGGYNTVDPKGTQFTTLLEASETATPKNPIFNDAFNTTGKKSTSYLTLEKILSSDGTNIGDIITSSVNTYEYDNYLEITDIDYSMTKTKKTGTFEFRDRVLRSYVDNNDWFWGDTEYSDENIEKFGDTDYILLAGIQHDMTKSDRITIHPPTGENRGYSYYYIIVGALIILITGVAFIKKFALTKETVPVVTTKFSDRRKRE